jgi:hypothetical protein
LRLHVAVQLQLFRLSNGWRLAPTDFCWFNVDELVRARAAIGWHNTMLSDWGCKDPRTTLCLPQWKALIPELKVVLAWRP